MNPTKLAKSQQLPLNPPEALRGLLDDVAKSLYEDIDHTNVLLGRCEQLAKALAKQGLGREEIAKLTRLSGNRHAIMNKFELASHDYDRAIKLYEKLGDTHRKARTPSDRQSGSWA